ncbi:MAG: N-acetylneuraminate synthase family protein [Desulfobacterales bacterium]|nr:N-acetylneuraminate synthase family protein [Desulfobacterales bacterium]
MNQRRKEVDKVQKNLKLGNRSIIGPGNPVYIIAEIGINHNGSIDLAKEMIRSAHKVGVNAVKFQKRNPEECVPLEQRDRMRETPWGYISYMDYRYKVEFGEKEYRDIDNLCKNLGIEWFVSCWDKTSVDFMERFDPICYKIPSAHITNKELLLYLKKTRRPLILSTGMSTMSEIRQAVELVGTDTLALAHCTSSYPAKLEELNLRMILTLRKMYDCPIGYSGHEVGLATSVVAVSLGACFVERHFTLDRASWGSDQASSVEIAGLARLVKDIRSVEIALGDGEKVVYESEMEIRERLRA